MTPDQEQFLNYYVYGEWQLRNGLVDVQGDLYRPSAKISDLRGIRFGRVSGSVNFRNNSLTSLIGMPRSVGGLFTVSGNLLQNLEGGPEEVGGEYNVEKNELDSLEGAPLRVGNGFYADELEVTDWSPEGWIRAWEDASPMGRSLLSDLLTPSHVNELIRQDSKGMVEILSLIWEDDDFWEIRQGLRFPAELGNINDLMALLQKARDLEGLL
jgi:hypothetical protein